jgi:hypothetical protein
MVSQGLLSLTPPRQVIKKALGNSLKEITDITAHELEAALKADIFRDKANSLKTKFIDPAVAAETVAVVRAFRNPKKNVKAKVGT